MPNDQLPAGIANRPFGTSLGDRSASAVISTEHLATLYAATLSRDPAEAHAAADKVIARGVRPDVIADFYIPEIARIMGDLWCSDEMSFANVTIGVARLQSLLRHLGPHWSGDQEASPAAPMILIIVPFDCFHTLGSMVLAGQLRRKGLSVRVLLGATGDDVGKALQQAHHEAVFVSVTDNASLDSAKKIVESVRSDATLPLPIVVGGALLETRPELASVTGADFASNDPDEAIALCGLTEKLANSFRIKRGTA